MMPKIKQLTALRNSAIIGLSSIVLSAVSLPAQAINLVQNGGFVPNNIGSYRSSGINAGTGTSGTLPSGITFDDWTVTDNPNNVSGYVNTLMYVVSDGNTFSAEGGVGMNNKGDNQRKSWTLFASSGQTVNSIDETGWYIASDGDPLYSASISQLVSGLTVGKEYTLKFSQAAGQFDCNFGNQSNRSTSCLERGTYFGETNRHWNVTFGDVTQQSTNMALASQAPVTPWQLQNMKFTATAPTQTLSFLAFGTPGGQPPVALLSGVSLDDGTPPPTPVPFETDALPIVGSMIAFGFGLRAKQKLAQKKLVKFE
ncbi:hypothetical protein H6F62_05670 [Anabaena sp. FACHB-1391]|uniref:hypothetical protein n=1 Tax=Anabaena sp. FACHB-1391 TaxID=2692771 RepID=UPI00168089F1|nr:hypothetical protein [Anabaena sp. FACHB-1391]MBD2268282.1 hypothetical protein [Anabaena sp. FACHB-1391]